MSVGLPSVMQTGRDIDVRFAQSAPIDGEHLNTLLRESWPDHTDRDFSAVLARSLVYVCAFTGGRLIGFVNVAWDGGAHAFLLDPTVHPNFRRRGIGRELVAIATAAARERGAEWLHVDYEPPLALFYQSCGFQSTAAGLVRLNVGSTNGPQKAGGYPVLEVAILNVKRGQSDAFRRAFSLAQQIIASAPGYGGHELRGCVEDDHRFLLLVHWNTVDSHQSGFRGSQRYQQWKGLLHDFYDPFPTVEHYVAHDQRGVAG
jgi:heme-degrading monooxygenase HmoA/GNAT superfamily N-acetyltransferase